MSLLCGAALVYTVLPLLTTQVSLPGVSLLYWSQQVVVLPSTAGLETAVFTLLVTGNCLVTTASPLLLEWTVETAFPVSEVITGGWIFLG